MNINVFFSSIQKQYIPMLPKATCKSIYDFYKVIEPLSPSKDTVVAWDSLLNRYIQETECLFFIRRYSSDPDRNWNNIRRGFLTKNRNNVGYVYCDNFFAHYFYVMAINNYIPEYQDFLQFINNRLIPYGSAQTKEEAPFQAFPVGKTSGINQAGWKLAHIFSVNENDYSFDYRKEKTVLFPLGEQKDWKVQNGVNYPYKYINRDLIGDERKKITAHFMRFVHPINYFLAPMKKYSNSSVTSDIGEYNKIIQYFYLKAKGKYGTVFEKYQETIMNNTYKNIYLVKNSLQDQVINLSFGLYLVNNPTTKESTKPVIKNQISSKTLNVLDLDLAIEYLYNPNTSFRKLELNIMHITSPVRGGGFKAKTIINSMGITAEKKGILAYKSIETELNNSTGRYYETLTMIKRKKSKT